MIPYTTEPREDTGVSNVTLGIWLFLASEVMLFGALFSACALLRVAAPAWPPPGQDLALAWPAANTAVLVGSTLAVWRARRQPGAAVRWLTIASGLAVVFLVLKGLEYRHDIAQGLVPAASTFLAMYFALTGLHALHVAGGVAANVWAAVGRAGVGADRTAARVGALALYWGFVDVVWLVIVAVIYLT